MVGLISPDREDKHRKLQDEINLKLDQLRQRQGFTSNQPSQNTTPKNGSVEKKDTKGVSAKGSALAKNLLKTKVIKNFVSAAKQGIMSRQTPKITRKVGLSTVGKNLSNPPPALSTKIV